VRGKLIFFQQRWESRWNFARCGMLPFDTINPAELDFSVV